MGKFGDRVRAMAEADSTTKFQRAVDLWQAAKIGTDLKTMVAAIDTAWRDQQLDEEELIALFAYCGYNVRRAIDASHGNPMSWHFEEAGTKSQNPIVVAAAPQIGPRGQTFETLQGPSTLIETPAHHAVFTPPHVRLEEADAAFADLEELLKP